MAVKPDGIVVLNAPKGYAIPDIIVSNVGRLPARDVEWVIQSAFQYERRWSGFTVDKSGLEGNNIIPPGTEMRQGGDQFEAAPVIRAARDVFLYVWGAVNYTDGFDQARTTYFCHRYNCVNFSGGRIEEHFARYHRFGNDAD